MGAAIPAIATIIIIICTHLTIIITIITEVAAITNSNNNNNSSNNNNNNRLQFVQFVEIVQQENIMEPRAVMAAKVSFDAVCVKIISIPAGESKKESHQVIYRLKVYVNLLQILAELCSGQG